jgi:hypothetical protein
MSSLLGPTTAAIVGGLVAHRAKIAGFLKKRPSAIIATPPPQESKKMALNVIQLIEQTVELGTALEGAVVAAQAELASGLPVTVPPISLKFGAHTYSVAIVFSKVS